MSNNWLRLWHDLPNDPKWRTIAKISKQPISAVIAVYIHMLVCASNATERGRTQAWCNEDVASALDLEIEQIVAICDAMQGRVLDGDRLRGWEKRQPNREDGSAERGKAYREKQKLIKELDELKNKNDELSRKLSERTRTQTNAPERKQPTDTDKDNTNSIVVKDNNITPSSSGSELSTIQDHDPPDDLGIDLDFNDIIVCSDFCCALLGKQKLDELDAMALQDWHQRLDMKWVILRMRDELTKRIREGKPTNSLRFFAYLTKKAPPRSEKMRV